MHFREGRTISHEEMVLCCGITEKYNDLPQASGGDEMARDRQDCFSAFHLIIASSPKVSSHQMCLPICLTALAVYCQLLLRELRGYQEARAIK